MRPIIWILLGHFFLLQTLTASASETSSYENWLKVQQTTIVKLNQINYSHIRGLRQCACFELKKLDSREGSCNNTNNDEPLFLREIINFYGESIAEKVNCKEILNLLVYARLEQDWPDMRAHLSLMKTPEYFVDPIKTETMQDVAYLNDGRRKKVDYLFPTALEHEIRNFPLNSKLNIAAVRDLSEIEIKDLLKVYFDFSVKTCLKLAPKFLEVTRWVAKAHAVSVGNTQSFCNKLILAQDGNIPLSETHRLRKYASSLLLKIQKARIVGFRDEHKKEYLELAQTNPLLLLVDSPEVKLLPLTEILVSIEANARERLERSVKDLNSNQNSEIYGGMTYALIYTRAIWRSQGLDPSEFQTYSERAYEAWQDKEFKKSAIEIGVVTAGVAACLVPWGRILRATLQLLKFSCLAGIGLPLNSYFLIDSIVEYRRGFDILFSSVETNQALDKAMTQVTSAQTTATIAAVLFPIGLNLVEAGHVIAAIKAFSRK